MAGLIAVNIFIVFFELGPGSVLWPFLADVCNDKGIAIGVVNNWFWALAVAVSGDQMNVRWVHGESFLLFGGLSALGFLYIAFYMKETERMYLCLSQDRIIQFQVSISLLYFPCKCKIG